MQPERGRTKKLILALHYHTQDKAGWRCEECRRGGLEEKRRCGWKGAWGEGEIVWARRGAASAACPKTAITADSVAWLELWGTWRQCGKGVEGWMSAKDLDAMALLESEWERTKHDER